jgi:DNA-binding transcriptional ArsR family regulator
MKDDVRETIKLFKALSCDKRLLILNHLLKNKSQSVSDISIQLGFNFKTTSRNLLVLGNARLVDCRQIRNEREYFICVSRTDRSRTLILKMVKRSFEKEILKEASLIADNPIIFNQDNLYRRH